MVSRSERNRGGFEARREGGFSFAGPSLCARPGVDGRCADRGLDGLSWASLSWVCGPSGAVGLVWMRGRLALDDGRRSHPVSAPLVALAFLDSDSVVVVRFVVAIGRCRALRWLGGSPSQSEVLLGHIGIRCVWRCRSSRRARSGRRCG